MARMKMEREMRNAVMASRRMARVMWAHGITLGKMGAQERERFGQMCQHAAEGALVINRLEAGKLRTTIYRA